MDNFKNKNIILLFRIIIFLLIFVLINYIFLYLFNKEQLFTSRTYKTDSQYHKMKTKINIIALGDSHASTGFDPRVFNTAFNFSSYGENYIYNYYKLKYILKTNNRIKIVILPIDLHTFSTWRAERFLYDFYWIKYVDYWELGLKKNELIRFIGKYITGKLFPYIGKFETIFKLKPQKTTKTNKNKTIVFQGFVIKKGVFNKKREKRTKQRIHLHFYKQKPFDQTVTEYFKKILQLCSENKIRLVLVKYPVSKIYYKYASNKVQTEGFYKKILSMTKTFNNIEILDLQKLFFKNDTYFDDPDHLNERGAKVLTTRIRNELNVK